MLYLPSLTVLALFKFILATFYSFAIIFWFDDVDPSIFRPLFFLDFYNDYDINELWCLLSSLFFVLGPLVRDQPVPAKLLPILPLIATTEYELPIERIGPAVLILDSPLGRFLFEGGTPFRNCCDLT